MKINLFKYLVVFLAIVTVFIIYFSLVGIETDKFNKQIKNKIIDINKSFDLDLKKIKFTLDPLNFRINAKTVGATIFYSKRPLPLEYIKTQVSLGSLIKKKIISSNFKIVTKSILLKDLIKFIRATYNKPELFILEKFVKKGHVILDLNLHLDQNGNIKDNYEIKGLLKNGKINFLNKSSFENINFNFDLKKDEYFFKDIKFLIEKINFKSEKFTIKKKKNTFFLEGIAQNSKSSLNKNFLKLTNINLKNINLDSVNFISKNKFSLEINDKLKFKNFRVDSDLIFDELRYKKPNIIENYFSDINEFILLKDQKIKLSYTDRGYIIKGEGKIQFENESDEIKYLIRKTDKNININSDIILKNINLKNQRFLKDYFPSTKEKINLKDHKLKISFADNKFSFYGKGRVKIDKNFEDIKYFFEKKENNFYFNTDLIIENTNIKIDNINYKNEEGVKTYLKINGNLDNKNKLTFSNLMLEENNNKIDILNLSLNNKNQIIKIEKAYFDYLDVENKKNKFLIKRINKNNYEIFGDKLNANKLITDLLDSDDKNELKIFKNDTNIKLNFDEVYIDETYIIKNLKGKFIIKKNEINYASMTANLRDKENILFSVSIDKDGNKITSLTSSWAKPFVNRYKFIKGFEDGYLDFYSRKKNGISNSKLIIDNFKVKEIPALAKLLALASLQGISDLLTGEGIRFTNFEMNFINKDNLMTIDEIYAIGPAISILMSGYVEEEKLISLRGTLVPATTINKSISSIPLLGKILVGNKTGEGVFGVSFKIKGPPKNLETTVNPVKTLTPRFITRTLEKLRKN